MTARKRQKDPTDSAQDLRDRLLMAALPDVAFDGWTPALLDRAATKAGIDRAAVNNVCPGGVDDLIIHFSNWADRQTEARLLAQDLGTLRRLKLKATRIEIGVYLHRVKDHQHDTAKSVGELQGFRKAAAHANRNLGIG